MAFPVIEGSNTSSESPGTTSHTVNLPSGIVSDELLTVFFATANGTDTIVTWPGDWTEFLSRDTGTNAKLTAAYRQADGGEGATITVTTDVSRRSAHTSYRISGAEDPATQVPEEANAAGFSVDADPPSLTPTGGAKDYLWIAAMTINGNDASIVAPTNYGNILNANTANPSIGSADRALNASSEDPGTFTSISGWWVSATVAVHPTSAAAIDIFFTTQFGQPQPVGIRREVVPY